MDGQDVVQGIGIGIGNGEVAEAAGIAERAGASGEELTALRDALLRAYPRAVPELVRGASVGELLESLDPAMAAWERVAAAVSVAVPGQGVGAERPPVVPAGNAPAAAVDPDRLPATEKIRRGLLGRG